ncbi:hypothetical protein [Phascolarctobacterium succinatutens]|uniref:hypothetical protein n=1 Tax=Phascolarctobacterium succinatutens TaxID=626940 RepID=UPI0023F822B4|nr:hypothetical protein [Phascolarctobacterium succinatutens]
MAFNELIKSFDNIRQMMRDFYVFGFKSRADFADKSARSYDNERRRIESWLGEYMYFRQNAGGKNCFISVDSRKIRHNPFYKALKAKSFTANDIMLHFFLLDILQPGENLLCVSLWKGWMQRIYLVLTNQWRWIFPLCARNWQNMQSLV